GPVILLLAAKLVVAQIHGGDVGGHAGIAAAVGRQGAVAGVLGPAQADDGRIGGVAVVVDEVLIGQGGRVGAAAADVLQGVALEGQAGEDAVDFGDRHAEVQAQAHGFDRIPAGGAAVGDVVGRSAAVVQGRGLA